ncbi:TITAN-like protein [Quillaja saponaria]|uniref:TITAN-like protein n=1 Tax=Quillaja saponaria TaxID=32244 RepID=A0AAD7LE20_QUISA|nr:TITAN-like protein [Quillaja saponaria]
MSPISFNMVFRISSKSLPCCLKMLEEMCILEHPLLGKSKKLNPKRVGAAWGEKRKIELDMEKRGEILRNEFDNNWLPNFGRVWQSGSRKESRKEFEVEKQKLLKVESQPEMPVKRQPYVSKRMRRYIDGSHASDDNSGPLRIASSENQ